MTEGAAGVVLRPIVTTDLPRLAELEIELFGAGAWSAAMLADELAGPGRWYVAAVPDPADPAGPRGPADPSGPDASDSDAADPRDLGARPLIGYAGTWYDGEDVQVMTIGVAGDAQGRGIGGMLLGALLDHARRIGATSAFLEVRVDNTPALALYERFGFERIGRRRRYYQPEDVDAWTMRVALASAPDAEERIDG